MTEDLQTKEKTNNAQADLNGLIPVSKWNDYHKYPTVGAIRQLIFKMNYNGFSKVLRRVSGRLYISESDFNNWINEKCRVGA